jgi:hypothetical protein
VKIAALDNVDVDPYFRIPMPDLLIRWQSAWLLLRNDTDAPLPAFTGSHPIPQPNWGYGVAQTDLRRLQLLLEVIWGLLQRVLIGVEILRTFFSYRVQRFVNEK